MLHEATQLESAEAALPANSGRLKMEDTFHSEKVVVSHIYF